MAVTVEESALQNPRSGTRKRQDKFLIVRGADGVGYLNATEHAIESVHLALDPTLITTVGNVLSLKKDETRAEEIADECYLVSVVYSDEREPELNSCTMQFQIAGQQTHITHGLGTINQYIPDGGDPAPDHKNAIGVRREDGKPVIDGTDIIVPEFSFSLQKDFGDELLTATYVSNVFGLVGSVNDSPLTIKGFTFAGGELLLQGASGGETAEAQASMTFDFAARENASDLTIAGIEEIDKDGWDHLWVETRIEEDADAKTLVPEVIAIHVERIYQRKDFSLLLICED